MPGAVLLAIALSLVLPVPLAAQTADTGSGDGGAASEQEGGAPAQPGIPLTPQQALDRLLGPETPVESGRAMSEQEIRELIQTLEDPARRDYLLEQLRRLEAATSAAQAAGEGAGTSGESAEPPPAAEPPGRFSTWLSGAVAWVESEIRTTIAVLRSDFRIRRAAARVRAVAQDPEARLAVTLDGLRVIGVLAAAWLAARLLATATAGALDRARLLTARWRLYRLLPRLLVGVIEITPVIVFLIVSWALFLAVPMAIPAQEIGISLASTIAGSATALIALRLGLAPNRPLQRPLPVGSTMAQRLFRSARRLVILVAAAVIAVNTLNALGFPATAADRLLKLLGLLFTLLIAVTILQLRQAIAEAISSTRARLSESYGESTSESPGGSTRGRAGETGGESAAAPSDASPASASGQTSRPERTRAQVAIDAGLAQLARFWHVLAILYVIVGYGLWAAEVRGGLVLFLRGSLLTVVILGLGQVVHMGIQRDLDRLFRVGTRLRQRVPSLPERVAFYRPIVGTVLTVLIFVAIVAGVFASWGAPVLSWLVMLVQLGFVGSIASLILIVALLAGTWEVIRGTIEWYLTGYGLDGRPRVRSPRTRTLLPFIRNMLFVLIGLVGTLMVLTEMGINVTPLLAGAGVIGLAIGFGAQTLVKDVITGLFILFESTVDVGDWVDLGGLQGEVERMTVRSIRLRDLHGTVHVIPFSEVTSVSNYTRDYAYALVDVPIAYQEDVDRLVDLMEQVAQHLREDPEVGRQILAPLEVFGLDRFEESAVIVRARLLTRPGQQWHVRRVYQAAIKRACEEAGIELALPHMKLYFGESRLGPTPPARVRQEGGDHHSGQAALPQGSRPASTGSDLVPSFTSSPGDSE